MCVAFSTAEIELDSNRTVIREMGSFSGTFYLFISHVRDLTFFLRGHVRAEDREEMGKNYCFATTVKGDRPSS